MATIKTAPPAKVSKAANKTNKAQEQVKTKATSKAAKLDEKNAEDIKKEITDKKELKYIYPADCTDLVKRKAFRTSTRGKRKTMEKEIANLAKAGDKKATEAKVKEFEAWKATVFVK